MVSKILKKAMQQAIEMKTGNENENLLSKSQHGFRINTHVRQLDSKENELWKVNRCSLCRLVKSV